MVEGGAPQDAPVPMGGAKRRRGIGLALTGGVAVILVLVVGVVLFGSVLDAAAPQAPVIKPYDPLLSH
jgi:hypothetical protein